jgi:hypothetical protein
METTVYQSTQGKNTSYLPQFLGSANNNNNNNYNNNK